MAKHYNFFASVKSLNDFTRENGFPRSGWRFKDKSAMLINNRWKTIDDILLPGSEMHARRISNNKPFCTNNELVGITLRLACILLLLCNILILMKEILV